VRRFIASAVVWNVEEPAVDLGAATAGCFRDRAVDPSTVLIGEVGLADKYDRFLKWNCV